MEYTSIVFGGGCFWCIEAIFAEVRGVVKLEPGYAGGETKNPTYHEVCTGTTGHAEVIRITFDPNVIDVVELYEVFFATHDPTTVNRQGNDVGTHYRSVVLYNSTSQRELAETAINAVNATGIYNSPVVTEVVELDDFYLAEDYHKNYFSSNSDAPYCSAVIAPKLSKFREKFRMILKS